MKRLSAPPAAPSPLAVRRFAAGLTQAALAERAGITRAAVANLEAGKHRPRRLTAMSLASVLGAEVEALFPKDVAPADNGCDEKGERDGARQISA